MRTLSIARLCAIATLAQVSACSSLPSAAPTAGQIVKGADRDPDQKIRVIDVLDQPDSAFLAPVPKSTGSNQWTIQDARRWRGEIAPGDRLTITIFEIGYALFGARDGDGEERSGGSPSAAGNSLPAVEVDRAGMIELPYVGRIAAAGLAPEQLARAIEHKLRGYSQNPQVVVSVTRGPGHSVILSGDVRQPGRQSLTIAGERLLDVIAQAGGPTNRAADIRVRLTRNDEIAERRLDAIHIDSPENVVLAAGDRIELVRDIRTMTVLGAAKSVSEIAFESDRVTLAEALARAGGPLDERGDPRGVFVFRYEREATMEGVQEVPVIYRLNLLDPRSYFAVQRFAMREKDVLLVANARSVQFGKVVQLLNQFVSPAVTVDLLTR